jgi:hypothetical protein
MIVPLSIILIRCVLAKRAIQAINRTRLIHVCVFHAMPPVRKARNEIHPIHVSASVVPALIVMRRWPMLLQRAVFVPILLRAAILALDVRMGI